MLSKNKKMNEPFIKELSVKDDLKKQNLTIPMGNVSPNKKYFDKEYIDDCINNEKNHIKKIYCLFLFRTGMRVSESTTIKKQDFDFKNNVLTIKWLKNRKKEYRIIPLHHSIISLMELYVANMKHDEIVFPWSRIQSYNITKEVLGSGPHKLRHSFAVHWLRSGGDIYILSKILGHSTAKITEKEYLDIVPLDQGKELQKINF